MMKILIIILSFYTTFVFGQSREMINIFQKHGNTIEIPLSDIDTIFFSLDTNKKYQKGPTVMDIEGNIYNSVVIDNRIWMSENLKTKTYNDGDTLINLTTYKEWESIKYPGWGYYNNEEMYNKDYGKLYSIKIDSNKICPTGWHLPTRVDRNSILRMINEKYDSSIYTLDYYGTDKLKEKGMTHWKYNIDTNITSYHEGTDEFGWKALPGGTAGFFGFYLDVNKSGSTALGQYGIWMNLFSIDFWGNWKSEKAYNALSYSIRCVSDE